MAGASASRGGGWQIHCTAEFRRCMDFRRRKARLAAWDEAKRRLWETAKATLPSGQQRIILADDDYSGRDLREVNLDYCYLVRVILSKADLRKARLRKAIIRDCDLTQADLRGADATHASVLNTPFDALRYNDQTRLALDLPTSDPARWEAWLKRAVDQAHAVEDARKHTRSSLLKIWNAATNYGQSPLRIAGVALITVSIFAAFYYLLYLTIDPFGVVDVQVWDFALLSIQRFLNLPSAIDSKWSYVQALFTVESATGIFIVSVFIAVLAGKVIVSSK